MNTNIKQFEETWSKYIDNLKAKLKQKLDTNSLNINSANFLLRESNDKWLYKYDIVGKWLNDFSEANPEKGALISEIIKNDIRFTEEIKPKELSVIVKFGVPVVTGLALGGISVFFTESLLVRAASALIPAAAAFPAVSTYAEQKKSIERVKVVDAYIDQLERYQKAIKEIINE